MQQFSLSITGANFSNPDNGATRRFEIETCRPGEPIELLLESRSLVDPRAVAVFSQRSIQIGYLTEEGGRWIAGMIANGRQIRAVFQRKTLFGAWIRIALDGLTPTLPEE